MSNYIKSRILSFFRIRNQIRLLKASDLFDIEWYNAKYGDKFDSSKITPEHHYLTLGHKLSYDPSEAFSTHLYLDQYPDVKESGLNPLVHYLVHGKKEKRQLFSSKVLSEHIGVVKQILATNKEHNQAELINSLGAFQAKWYSATYFESELSEQQSLTHFLKTGFRKGCDPTPAFSCADYFSAYPDILNKNVNPYSHYLEHGKFEGRESKLSKNANSSDLTAILRDLTLSDKLTSIDLVLGNSQWFDPIWFSEKYDVSFLSTADMRKYYLIFGEVLNLDPHPFFSTERNRKKFSNQLNGLAHTIELVLQGKIKAGQVEMSSLASADDIEKAFNNFKPDKQTIDKAMVIKKSKWFNRNWYRSTYKLEHIPLEDLALHYCTVGIIKEYDPCPSFSASFYMNSHPDVKIHENNALYHYITTGRKEGRQISFSRYARRMLGNETFLFSESFLNTSSRAIESKSASFYQDNTITSDISRSSLSITDYKSRLSEFLQASTIEIEKIIKDAKWVDISTLRIFLCQEFAELAPNLEISFHFISNDQNEIETVCFTKFQCYFLDISLYNRYGSLIIELSKNGASYFLSLPFVSLLKGGDHFHELCFNKSLNNYLSSVSEYGTHLYQLKQNIKEPLITELLIDLDDFDINSVLFNSGYISFINSFGVRFSYKEGKVLKETETIIYSDLNIQSEDDSANQKISMSSSCFIGAKLTIKAMISLALGQAVDESLFIYVEDNESSQTSIFSISKDKESKSTDYNPLFIVNSEESSPSLCHRMSPTLEVFSLPSSQISDLAVVLFIDGQISVSNIASILSEFTFDYHLYLILLDINQNLSLDIFRYLEKKVTLISSQDDELEDLSSIFANITEGKSLIIVDDISPFSRSYLDYMLTKVKADSKFLIPQECFVQRRGKGYLDWHGESALVTDLKNSKSFPVSVNTNDEVIHVDWARTKVALLNNSSLESTNFNLFKYDKNDRRLHYDAMCHKVELLPQITVNTVTSEIKINSNNSDQDSVRLS